MFVLPWSATGRYVRHLENEIEYLRCQLDARYETRKRRGERKVDVVPEEVIELCRKFETHGGRVLEELKRERARTGASWDTLADRVRQHIAAHANGDGG